MKKHLGQKNKEIIPASEQTESGDFAVLHVLWHDKKAKAQFRLKNGYNLISLCRAR